MATDQIRKERRPRQIVCVRTRAHASRVHVVEEDSRTRRKRLRRGRNKPHTSLEHKKDDEVGDMDTGHTCNQTPKKKIKQKHWDHALYELTES